jgi:UDP-glucose 4-epimerase|tara:strand:- start:996 stop:1829 length:834 start_codon:yes stop_codon:yes gene_type:complete
VGKRAVILVTGYKGFIGSHLFERLPTDQRIGIDLKDGEDLLDQLPDIQVDVVFHLAAQPSVGYSVENPSYTLKHNVLGTSRVLEWAKNHGAKRVVFSSSSAIYGDGSGPNSPYGLHKSMSEMECKLYSELYGLDTVCLRYFNAYAEDQEYGGSYSTVISAWMELIKQSKPLRIDGDGEQTRDYIHVDDIVSANLFCANYEGKFAGSCFDVGTGEAISLNSVKEFVKERYKVKWQQAPEREGDVRHTLASIKPLQDLGWEAKIKIADGLKKCFIGETK